MRPAFAWTALPALWEGNVAGNSHDVDRASDPGVVVPFLHVAIQPSSELDE